MKYKISTSFLFIVFFVFLNNKPAVSADWSATIKAAGEITDGVNEYSVVIGEDKKNENLPAPPSPPDYSVKMDLVDPESYVLLAKDLRRKKKHSPHIWIISVDPNGSAPPFIDGTAVISWDPSKLGKGSFDLREGYDGTGTIVVPDMKEVSSYSITGKSETYFTIVNRPDGNKHKK